MSAQVEGVCCSRATNDCGLGKQYVSDKVQGANATRLLQPQNKTNSFLMKTDQLGDTP